MTKVFAEWLTPERERGIRRQHERLHPNGYVGQRVCDVCLLLARLTLEREAQGRVIEAAQPVIRRWREGKSCPDEIALLDVAVAAAGASETL